MKTCRTCQKELPLENFKKGRGEYVYPHCYQCSYKLYGPRSREYMKEYSSKPENKEKYREANYRRVYGVGIDWYNEKIEEQDGKCAICGSDSPKNQRVKYFSIDHDHKTDKLRGLLCNPCNMGMGLLAEDEDSINRLLDYLHKYGYDG